MKLSGLHSTRGLALQSVVADRGRGSQRLVDVPDLEQVTTRRRLSPDARVAVRLQFEPNTEPFCPTLSRSRRSSTRSLVPSKFCTWCPISCASA